MHREFLMGNEAIALGALAAGVNFVSGYPGTPSTEVLETVASRNPGHVHVEWSVNEKAALEAAAGAAYAGARTMVTMKQVGLNVACDPLMSLEYIGVKGGMVIMVADDPGPISSQTEQDTRSFASFSKVPVFDPSSVEEAYDMIQEAFAFSEEWKTPVFFRATTRIDHGYESIEVKDPSEYEIHKAEGFVKDPSKWVIFPALSVRSHARIEERNAGMSVSLSDYRRNFILPACGAYAGDEMPSDRNREGEGFVPSAGRDNEFRPSAGTEAQTGSGRLRKGIATHGISYMYTLDALGEESRPRLLRVAVPFPFPEKLAADFLRGLDEVLCIEELDPVIERELTHVCGKYGLNVRIRGKRTGDIAPSGENTVDSVAVALAEFLGDASLRTTAAELPELPPLPVRPPVLCAGCPHRASFYAVKQAMKGRRTFYGGDIGCYTLGNAAPLDMCDTCLCMGAGINIAQGIWRTEPDTKCFAFVGDSTFFASGITGVINAVYNQADLTLIVLDNSTTAMTGHQPHPGTGRTMMGQVVEKVSIERILEAIGLTAVETVNPLDLREAVHTVRRTADLPGVKAIIFRSPCIALGKAAAASAVQKDLCIGCKKCIRELGCPALMYEDNKACIDTSQCTGCMLCAQVCPAGAIISGTETE